MQDGWPSPRVRRPGPSRESLKTPSRAESRVALNITKSLEIESYDCPTGQGDSFISRMSGVRVPEGRFSTFFAGCFGLIFGTGLKLCCESKQC